MTVLHVVGARPNFMKIAPIMAEMGRHSGAFMQVLVHTGQHYDHTMSKVFFEDLEIPVPDEFLNVGSGTHAAQTAGVMLAFEPVLLKHRPDWVVVVGDVNSTVACALVCAKLGVRVAHVEAGLRSNDRTMPEEINRILTDHIADLLFTTSPDANANLSREGIPPEKVHFVGNVMIDTMVKMLPKAIQRPVLNTLCLEPKKYFLVTMHRPCNVDHPDTFKEILSALASISEFGTVVFPVHPRTRKMLEALAQPGLDSRVRLIDPLGYLDFLALMNSAGAVLTDSGGVQEETTYLGVPCLTVRPNTERPVTVSEGTNRLVASDAKAIVTAFRETVSSAPTHTRAPELWDGLASARLVRVMMAEGPVGLATQGEVQ